MSQPSAGTFCLLRRRRLGGAADIAGRLSAASAEKEIGQPISVVNKLGGGGAIGFDYVGKRAPDGYNIGWLSASILTTTLLGRLPYDYTHFDYVCGVTFDATAIAVRADAPWKTLPEFIAAVKAKPNKSRSATPAPPVSLTWSHRP